MYLWFVYICMYECFYGCISIFIYSKDISLIHPYLHISTWYIWSIYIDTLAYRSSFNVHKHIHLYKLPTYTSYIHLHLSYIYASNHPHAHTNHIHTPTCTPTHAHTHTPFHIGSTDMDMESEVPHRKNSANSLLTSTTLESHSNDRLVYTCMYVCVYQDMYVFTHIWSYVFSKIHYFMLPQSIGHLCTYIRLP